MFICFSTTLTVDPSGELAIQQLLLPANDYLPGSSVRYAFKHFVNQSVSCQFPAS